MGKTATAVDPLVAKVARALRVKADEVLGAREDDENGSIYAVVADGRKVCIHGRDVEILTGPGYVDPEGGDDDISIEDLLKEIAAERKAERQAGRRR
jgi:hypothetical protein